jgi:phenylpropionate dioxygenase-like ring-hydroxylating dioxygenase large terminal subunit
VRRTGKLNAAIGRAWTKAAFPTAFIHDPEAYQREQQQLFPGSTWECLRLEAEVRNPGDFRTTYIGDMRGHRKP